MIQIASEPFNNRVYQKDSGGNATITKNITFDGSPTSLEYRVVNNSGVELQPWAEFDSSPSGGASTLSFQSAPSTDKKFVEVRKQPSLESTQELIGWYVGNIVLIIGQSLAQELSTIGSAPPLASYFVWNGSDGVSASAGSGQRELARVIIESENCAVMIVNAAVGSTALTQSAGSSDYWNRPDGTLWTNTLSQVNTATGGGNRVYFVWWHQGTADAESGVSESAYLAASIEFFNRVKSNILKPDGNGADIVYAQYSRIINGTSTDEERQAIRNAQIAVENEINGIVPVNTYKYESRDGVHFTPTGYEKVARQIVQTFYVYSGAVSGEPLRIVGADKLLNQNKIKITFNQDISSGTYSTEGVKVTSDGDDVQVVGFESVSNNEAAITTGSSFGLYSSVSLSYGNGETLNELAMPTSNPISAPNAEQIELNALATTSTQIGNIMALVPHKITALAESDAQGTDGKNIVVGAIVLLYNQNDQLVTMFDDAAGNGGAQSKQTDSEGQIVVYVEPGIYKEEINGGTRRSVVVSDFVGLEPAQQRTSLGLGNSSTLNVGTSSGTVAAGNDSRITGSAQKSANLSDLASASTARNNLGLGDIATESKKSFLQGIRQSLLDSPLCRLFAPNKLVDTLAGSLTSTRASTATYIDRYGVVKTAAIDEMREESEGWLIEGASTNLLTYSEQFDNAVWNKAGGSITPNSTIAPDLTTTADSFIENTSNSEHFLQQLSTNSAGKYSYSIFVKPLSGDRDLRIRVGDSGGFIGAAFFDPDAGDVVSSQNVTAKIVPVYGGWHRISVSGTTTGSNTSMQVYLVQKGQTATTYTGNGSSGMVFWGAQIEQLPFSSSYIPTTTATATRAADLIDFNGYNNTNLGEFSVFVNASLFESDYIFDTDNESNRFGIVKLGATAIQSFIASGGSAALLISVEVLDFVKTPILMTFDGSTLSNFVSGDFVNSVASGAPLEVSNTVTIGRRFNGTQNMYGHLSDFRIYDFALNEDEAAYLSGVK